MKSTNELPSSTVYIFFVQKCPVSLPTPRSLFAHMNQVKPDSHNQLYKHLNYPLKLPSAFTYVCRNSDVLLQRL